MLFLFVVFFFIFGIKGYVVNNGFKRVVFFLFLVLLWREFFYEGLGFDDVVDLFFIVFLFWDICDEISYLYFGMLDECFKMFWDWCWNLLVENNFFGVFEFWFGV